MAKAERRGLALGRKKQTRAKRKRHLIVSNGRVTETEYFNFLINEMDVRGSVRYRYIDGDPLKVAKKVSRELESDKKAVKAGEIDELSSVWIVVDSDEFRNLAAAEREARVKGVKLAISNPCFEVWLIDHVSPCSDSYASTPQCEKRARDLGLLKSTDPNRSSASKYKSVNLQMISGNKGQALANAAKHNTDDKRRARQSNPDNVSSYQVWTDLPELITDVFDSGK